MRHRGIVHLVILSFCVLAAPFVMEAQQAGRVYRIGVLSPRSSPPGPLEAFREGLRDLGYVEGRTVVIEWRFAEGKNERLPSLAEELVRLKVDVIFAINTPAAWAAKRATTIIPIVIARLADPTKTGLVSSIARPGGNITGVSSIAEELATKRLELVKDTLPGVSRVVMVYNPDNPGHLQVVKDTVHANSQLGLQLDVHGVRGASDLPEVFQAAARGRAQALLVQDDVRVTILKQAILDQAARQSLPVFAQYRAPLVTFATAVADEYRQAASYIDRILKGAKPADLPIQQPTRFELILNLKTAKTLHLTIPQSMLARADEVIQ